jgi:MOSC domain-containing protein YiiM
MQNTWGDPSTYDERDLVRTVSQFEGFVKQYGTSDGRGLTPVAIPARIDQALNDSLRRLQRSTVGDFEQRCVRLTTGPVDANWRSAVDAMLQIGVATLSQSAEQRRIDRNSSQSGEVSALYISNGGVPKKPVNEVAVGWRGLDGDRQAARQHHGRPWQALCLWSTEVIARLQAEGHPIAAGYAGENITLTGIDWSDAIAGTRLHINDVVLELTISALPCKKNAQWFNDRDFNRMHHAYEAGVTRMYAAVIQPGTIRVGSSAVLHLR